MTIAETNYINCCNTTSDINEHLPTLLHYANMCNHITEMGVREVVSTWAFLHAQPKQLISYDIYTSENIKSAYNAAKEINVDFKFIEADVLTINIDETDLLFIDTLHQYKQLKRELEIHSNNVRKYIIMHDTTKFGISDEYTGHPGGLWPAVEEFLHNNNLWELEMKYTNNNGLTILRRL
jgi:hypothetical protein